MLITRDYGPDETKRARASEANNGDVAILNHGFYRIRYFGANSCYKKNVLFLWKYKNMHRLRLYLNFDNLYLKLLIVIEKH